MMKSNYMTEYIDRRFKMKLKGALLLVVAATVCALSGLLSPQEAAASVDVVNQWPAKPTIVSNSAAGTITGIYIPGAGSNRVMLVAVATEYSAAGTPALAVTYGGQAVTLIPSASNTAQNNKIWLGYLLETGIATGSAGTKILQVVNSGTGTVAATYVTVAVYGGVSQVAPTGLAAATASATSLATGAYAVTGSAANMGLSVYVANWNGQTSTAGGTPTHTEIRDYAGTNFNLASGYSVVTTGTTTSNPSTSVGVAAIGAIAGAGLAAVTNTGTNYATVTTCGDCHGNPPQDGTYVTARNNPPGQFQGAHSKHSGKDEGQYGYACTVCHYNAATTKHSTGFKNISGSKVPRNTYGGVTNIAATNSPNYTLTCTKSTCHSTGRGTVITQYSPSPGWTGTTTCLSCHGGRNSGTNAYAKTTTTNFGLSTTHSQHLGKYAYTDINCQTCHGKTATNHTALKDYTGAIYHGNGNKTVVFKDIAYGSYTSYKAAGVNQGKCTNTSCHGGKSRSAWSNAGSVNTSNTCVHCHGVDGTSAALPNIAANRKFFAPGYNKVGTSTDQINSSADKRVGSHFKHLSSVYMKAVKCNECHRVPDSPFGGGNHTLNTLRYNSNTLTFAQASTAVITIGVAKASTPTRLASFGGYTNGTATTAATCSSVYCHGSRLKTADTSGTVRTPYWNYSAMINYTNPTVACSRCHGFPPTTGSSASTHSGKVLNQCKDCHSSVVNVLGQITNRTLHINGIVDADNGHAFGYGGSKHRPGGTGAIVANSVQPFTNCGCHTAASGGTYPVTRGNAANINCSNCHTNYANFIGATPGCADCHGLNATGAPNGAANAFPNWSGSHTAHIAQTYTCADCHVGGGTGAATHGNYSSILKTRANVTVAFNTAKAGTAAAWTAGTMTCSTSTCHGQKSPVWGQALPAGGSCFYCHGSQSTAFLGYTQAAIAPGTNNLDTNRGTGVTNRGGMHQQHLTATMGIADKVRCIACHASTTAKNHAQLDNMTTALITFSDHALDHSRTPSVTRVNGLITCNNTGCHAAKTGTGAAAPVWNNAAYLSGTNSSSTLTVPDCQKCHAFPPTPGSGSHTGLATITGFPINSQCGSNCHTNLRTDQTTFGAIFVNKSEHIDGKVQGGDCISCHSVVKGNRGAVVGQFASQSHHIQGIELPLTTVDCYKCHWEANSDGTENIAYHSQTSGKGVSLVNWNGATTRPTVVDSATLISYTANGSRKQIKKVNDVCLGCHNSKNIPAANLFGTFASDQYSPEPKMIPALGKSSILSRYSSTRTVAWSLYNTTMQDGATVDYGTNRKSSTIKALSAHGNAANNDMPAWDATANGTGEDETMADYTYAGASGNRNVFCYDCHNSHGSNATGITSSYSSATGRYKGGLLKTTIAGQGGYAATYTPAARTISYNNYSAYTKQSALFNTGASICNDCHNDNNAYSKAPAVPAAGITTKPWGLYRTYSSTRNTLTGYWSTPYFDNYTFASAKRTVYKAGGASGMKNLTLPRGGHFGQSVDTARGGQAGHAGEINGLCTPCHDPHGVSSAMTTVNRGKSVPLLKGTWVTSPYREDKATPVVKRGGGSNYAGMNNQGSMPGYNIDQNTLVTLPAAVNTGGAATTAKSNKRAQVFTLFPGAAGNALTLHNQGDNTPDNFAGLCIGCHTQTALTGSAAATTSQAWLDPKRVHQSVGGWGPTNGTNINNTVHAYTCAKCHTPHVSRLPRLLITNCLDVRHVKRSVAGGSINTASGTAAANFGNVLQSYASSAYGAGRFPGGGSRYSSTPTTAQNNGPWYFQTVQPAAVTYGSNCHNSATSGGATWTPANQMWNKKTRW
jgi:predicted CxxxxCH...CXXCH cytochrome family protein